MASRRADATELKEAQSLEDIEEVAAPRYDREVYWYDVPKSIATKVEISRMGLVELTAGEELMATSRGRNDAMRIAVELFQESVRYVDDRQISTGDGSAEAFWSRRRSGMSNLRQLAVAAYQQIHNPKQSEVADFLQSQKVTA